jgi:hypothetical protein
VVPVAQSAPPSGGEFQDEKETVFEPRGSLSELRHGLPTEPAPAKAVGVGSVPDEGVLQGDAGNDDGKEDALQGDAADDDRKEDALQGGAGDDDGKEDVLQDGAGDDDRKEDVLQSDAGNDDEIEAAMGKSGDARSVYEREAEEYAREVAGSGYLSETLGFGQDTWSGGVSGSGRTDQIEATKSPIETMEVHLPETHNEEMAESMAASETPNAENPPPRKFDFDWGINAELDLASKPSEEIDFKWRIDPEEIGRSQINSISAAADEKKREEAAKARVEEARSIFHDDTFDLRRDPDAEARFLFNKKNEEFQELLDQEFLKMQERQSKIDEERNRIDGDIMKAPVKTPESLVSGNDAYQAAEARINDFLMRADREMLTEIERRVQARKKAMEKKEAGAFTLEDVEVETSNGETAISEVADIAEPYHGIPASEVAISDPADIAGSYDAMSAGEAAGDAWREPIAPVSSPQIEADMGKAHPTLSIFDETVVAPIFDFPSTVGTSPDVQVGGPILPEFESSQPESGLSQAVIDPSQPESGLSQAVIDPPQPESGLSQAVVDPPQPESGLSQAVVDPLQPETPENVFIPIDKDVDALPPYDWHRRTQAAAPDIINQPIIFPFDEDTGYTEKTLYDEGTVESELIKETASALVLDVETDIESEDPQSIGSIGKAAPFLESFVDSSVVGPAFEPFFTPRSSKISIAAASGVETEAAVVHPMLISESLIGHAETPEVLKEAESSVHAGTSEAFKEAESSVDKGTSKAPIQAEGFDLSGESKASAQIRTSEAPIQAEEFDLSGEAKASAQIRTSEAPVQAEGFDLSGKPEAFTQIDTPEAPAHAGASKVPNEAEAFIQTERLDAHKGSETSVPASADKGSNQTEAAASDPPKSDVATGAEQNAENTTGKLPPQTSGESGTPNAPVSNKKEAAEPVPRRKAGRIILTIFLDLVVIVAVIVAGAFAIMRFAPDTAIGNVINNAFYGIVEMFKGEPIQSPTGNDPTAETEVVPDIVAPATDKATLVNDQLFNNRNGIKTVIYDPDAKYEAGRVYPIEEAEKSTSLGNNFWIEDAYGIILYDESAVASVIRYNSSLIGYINSGDTSILGEMVEGSKAELKCFGEAGQLTHIEIDYLGIGDIRRNGELIIVWTNEVLKEVRSGETFEVNRKMVYLLKPEGLILKVNDFAVIE